MEVSRGVAVENLHWNGFPDVGMIPDNVEDWAYQTEG